MLIVICSEVVLIYFKRFSFIRLEKWDKTKEYVGQEYSVIRKRFEPCTSKCNSGGGP